MQSGGKMTTVSLQFYQAGYCKHIEALCIKGGRWKVKQFPALVTLIHHPNHGYYLFDTGYSSRFFEETAHFPAKLYAWLTPVSYTPENAIAHQLVKRALSPNKIQGIILSHFHADHIAALKDFPRATLYCQKEAYTQLTIKSPMQKLIKGFLPGLLPIDFIDRLSFIDTLPRVSLEKKLAPFDLAYDLFQDGSVLAIPLPGHAKGQIGLYCKTAKNDYFLVADACWDKSAFTQMRLPHPLTNLIMDNVKDYQATVHKLHLLHKINPELHIVPSHCQSTISSLLKGQV